jgi:DNA-binding IclR family transcriptional regulator
VALTVRDAEDAAVVLDVRSPRHADMHIAYRPGLRHPVAIAASGIALLAGSPPRPSERREVTQARKRGWSQSTGELLPGATGVAAPVGSADAAVSAVWIGGRDAAVMARSVMATAHRLAEAL